MKPRGPIVAVIAGVLLRFAWAVLWPDTVTHDAAMYRSLAHAIASGQGYTLDARPSAYWLPGWPVWMSIFYRLAASDVAVMLASAVLGIATVAATWLLAREMGLVAQSWLAAALCALVPSLVLLPRLLLSENLALPLFVLAVVALVRASRTGRLGDWLLFGVAAAAVTYVRESCVTLVLAGPLLARRPQRVQWPKSLAAMVLAGLLLVPWVARNRATIGVTGLTTSAGVNLCIGVGPGATGGYRRVVGAPVSPEVSEVEANRHGAACAKEGLREHPLELVTLAPSKLSRLLVWDDWMVDDFLFRSATPSWLPIVARVLCDGFYWALLALSFVAWREMKLALVVFATVALPVLVTFGAGRFHAPLLPLLCISASRGILGACNPERRPKASQSSSS